MKSVILTLTGLALLAGCGPSRDDRIRFDGQLFRMNASTVDRDNRKLFEVTVRPVSASLDGAREAGRYEAIRYCIENYGTSDMIWSVGPDTEGTALAVTNDTLTFRGACNPK
ncbi:hypothetical protein [Thalassococcus sp. S3]|uniref:hypothetical protein n=1 Tax=Thalassococcus sp. S3 TaxID=2017482 RepID=UPI0010240116|nr:hypothetical protein [Thalassococcus sp. S3]QBF31344.1 hypothetical protein CFI11_08945 [Thalassococcus sp. S3]